MNRELDMHPNPDDRYTPKENRVRSLARSLPYPPTPDFSRRAAAWMSPQRQPKYSLQRQATWIVVGLAILLIALIAVPPVRAQLIQWIRIGAVEIFRLEPTPTPSPVAPSVPAVSPSLTPAPTPTILHSPLDLAGQTTLEAAREKVVSFPIRLPGYPEDLG